MQNTINKLAEQFGQREASTPALPLTLGSSANP